MVTKSVTLTELIDDLDGGKADRTIAFTFDGINYEIDLAKKNAAAFEKSIKLYVEHARKARRAPARAAGRRRAGAVAAGPDLAAVREWARANGHSVSDRGRIAASVMEAYAAAK
jgi:hypothetical protein